MLDYECRQNHNKIARADHDIPPNFRAPQLWQKWAQQKVSSADDDRLGWNIILGERI